MKRLIITLATLSFLIAPGIQAQDLQALFYHAGFFSPSEGPYVETYLKVFGPSAEFNKNENDKYQASLEVTILFKQDDQIRDFRKYNLLSEEVTDTSGTLPNFIDQQRIPLPHGVYQMELVLKDNNIEETAVEHAEMISLEYDQADVRFSDFQFVESFAPSNEESILTKSGYDLVPFVGDFYPAEVESLTFYTELYNLDQSIGQDQDFLFRYYLESFETTISLSDFARFQRQKAGPVNVVLATIPITNLPSGNYNLVVEARDRENAELLVHKIFFQRHNPGIQVNLEDIGSVDISSTFAERINDHDSINFYIGCLRPVANSLEKQFAKNVIKSGDIKKKQQFLFSFWETRNEQYPEAEWNRYKQEVMKVEDRFKTQIKHGFETDLGRIWLRYGPPNDSEFSDHEPNSYPYAMWHYYTLEGNQSNKRFIFYNPHLVGTEYFLLHSDARGELYNPYWKVDLHGRNTNLRNYEDYDFDSGWGGRAGSKIIK